MDPAWVYNETVRMFAIGGEPPHEGRDAVSERLLLGGERPAAVGELPGRQAGTPLFGDARLLAEVRLGLEDLHRLEHHLRRHPDAGRFPVALEADRLVEAVDVVPHEHNRVRVVAPRGVVDPACKQGRCCRHVLAARKKLVGNVVEFPERPWVNKSEARKVLKERTMQERRFYQTEKIVDE